MPIPGTTKLHRLQENIASVEVVLTPDDLREIQDALSDIKVEGEHYSPQQMAAVGR